MLSMYFSTHVWYFMLLTVPISILSAEFVFMGRQKRRSFFVLRILAGLVFLFAYVFLMPMFSRSSEVGDIVYQIFYFFLQYVCTILVMYFLFDFPFLKVVFYCAAGLLLYYIVSSVRSMIQLNFVSGEGSTRLQLFSFCITCLVDLVLFLLFSKRIALIRTENLKSKTIILIVIFSLIVVVSFDQICQLIETKNTLKMLIYICFCFNCFSILLFQFFFLSKVKLKNDIERINYMWEVDRENYEYNRSVIDSINIKWHDLKYMQSLENKEELNLRLVGSLNSFGNKALDAIILEKETLCYNRGIRFSYSCDGTILDFLEDVEIYSLVGNLLDNAIEAVMKNSDEQKRVVNFFCEKRQNSGIVLHTDNYYEGEVLFENGLPQTTKEDKGNHGWGLKSVKLLVEKYRGNMYISISDGIFSIDIVFITE